MFSKKKQVKTVKRKENTKSSFNLFAFLRKNFLLVLILVLMPVTVLAYQYNLSNRSSAAGRNMFQTQDKRLNLQGTVKTCGGSECNPGDSDICRTDNGRNTGTRCTCVATVWEKGDGNITTDDCQNYGWRCTEDKNACPVPPTQAPQAECSEGDQQISGACGNNPDGSDTRCRVCRNGVWGSIEDCPDNARVARVCFPKYNPPPTVVPSSPPQQQEEPRSNLGDCVNVQTDAGPGCWCTKGGWQYHYCVNWGQVNQYCNPIRNPCS